MTEQTTSRDHLATVTVLPTARTADPDTDTLIIDSARRVLAGVDLRKTEPPAKKVGVDLDEWDDRPLIPAWMRSPEGWAARSGQLYRARRRAARRWVRRQRTDSGHAAQFRRGSRRLHDWAVGLEGVQVQSLHHAAQIAARQARAANRTARFTPRLMPVKYKTAMAAAEKATKNAETLTSQYRKARKERARARQIIDALVEHGDGDEAQQAVNNLLMDHGRAAMDEAFLTLGVQ